MPWIRIAADRLYHYVIVRSDVPAGVQAAQIIHAAGESGPAEPTTFAVALHARPEQLLLLEVALLQAGVRFVAIREPDPPWDGALMAIGIHPVRKHEVAHLVRKYPLVK
jgi:hypothetical protein